MIFEHMDYRDYLNAELARRKGDNPRYSLRAMALSIGVPPSQLSNVLNRSKNISIEASYKIADRLGLDTAQTEYFSLLVQVQLTKDLEVKTTLIEKLKKLNRNGTVFFENIEKFKAISEWYHLAILELTEIKDFEFNVKNVALKLNISNYDAKEAIQRLLDLNLLIKEGQEYRKRSSKIDFVSQDKNNALRQYHKKMLEKATDAIDTQTPQQKYVGTETIAFDKNMLEEAKKIIRVCIQDLKELSEKSKEKQDLYHFIAEFFSLTQNKTKNRRNHV